jgi:hypothetical protein
LITTKHSLFESKEYEFESEKGLANSGYLKKLNTVKSKTSPYSLEEEVEDCVIMDVSFPELNKNEEDDLIKKINSLSKINDKEPFYCDVLERMFMLFL